MDVSTPAFRALELKRNPFGELTPDEWAAVAVVDVDPLVAWLDRPGRCLQLVGDCGRGKTTHLHALRVAMDGAVWRRAGVDGPGPGELLLLDEADAVGPVLRWRHLRRSSRCAVAVHADFSHQLRWMGWDVRTVRIAVRDPDVVAAIAARRIAALSGERTVELPTDLDALHAETGDDLRLLMDRLYDHWQQPLEGADVAL